MDIDGKRRDRVEEKGVGKQRHVDIPQNRRVGGTLRFTIFLIFTKRIHVSVGH